LNLHPGFASSRVFHTEIIQDIEEQYELHPEVIAEFRLPAEHVPVDMYFSRRKIHAEYAVEGTAQRIDTDTFMTYVPKDVAEAAIIYLTRISSFRAAQATSDPMYIPLAAKYGAPAKFGQYVARHNEFLNSHRNIAIVGIVPDAMDANIVLGGNLWTKSVPSQASFGATLAAAPQTSENGTYRAPPPTTKTSATGLTVT
jgi:hypothetical protein